MSTERALITIQVADETHKDLLLAAGAVVIAHPTVDVAYYTLQIVSTNEDANFVVANLRAIAPNAIYSIDLPDSGNFFQDAKKWLSENIAVVIASVISVGIIGLFVSGVLT